MKIGEQTIFLVSFFVIAFFIFGTIVIAQPEEYSSDDRGVVISDSQDKIDELNHSFGTTRYVIDGTIPKRLSFTASVAP